MRAQRAFVENRVPLSPTPFGPVPSSCHSPDGLVFTAVLIVVAQWVVIKHPGSDWLLLAVLGMPALFAAYTLTRALTVTTIEPARRRGRR